MACKECGGKVPKRETHTGGIQPFYCSDSCRLDAKRRSYREWRLRNLEQERLRDRISGQVNFERRKQTRLKRYADNREAINARARENNRARPDLARARERRWRESHLDAARKKNRRAQIKRRAVKKHVFVEHVDRYVVFQRDSGTCGICKQRVDKDSAWEIDHMIPVSRGGAHAYANVQLAHRSCNRKKHASLPVGQPNLFQVAV